MEKSRLDFIQNGLNFRTINWNSRRLIKNWSWLCESLTQSEWFVSRTENDSHSVCWCETRIIPRGKQSYFLKYTVFVLKKNTSVTSRQMQYLPLPEYCFDHSWWQDPVHVYICANSGIFCGIIFWDVDPNEKDLPNVRWDYMLPHKRAGISENQVARIILN